MPTPILMPALSPTMEKGTLAKWHVREGDIVAPGDLIAEIETDKATMEVEAVDEGRIGKLLVAEGTEHVPVNQPIALLLTEDDTADTSRTAAGASSFATRPAAAPQEAAPQDKQAAPHPEDRASTPVAKGEARAYPLREERSSGSDRGGGNGSHRLFASPLARRVARERGLDLGEIRGSGPHGRIVMADIERAATEERAKAAVEPATEQRSMVRRPAPQLTGLGQAMSDESVRALYEPGSYALVPHDTMRRFIADRLTLAQQTIPHFYLSLDC
jgi:pyruvate dehydrogenase E2 component (dihydrolipoamide acetyltransferase)